MKAYAFTKDPWKLLVAIMTNRSSREFMSVGSIWAINEADLRVLLYKTNKGAYCCAVNGIPEGLLQPQLDKAYMNQTCFSIFNVIFRPFLGQQKLRSTGIFTNKCPF